MRKQDIDTPALLLDLDIFETNIRAMSDYFKDKKARLRPHIKSHKTPEIAKRQIRAGAIGITCAKLSEAEVMADAGITGILIANQVVGPAKTPKLIDLAKKADIIVAVCEKENIDELAQAAEDKTTRLNVVIEVEVGMNRCGVMPGQDAVALAQYILGREWLNFRGIMGYEGHAIGIEAACLRKEKALEADKLLVDTAELLRQAGIRVEIVSAGGTGTFDTTGNHPGITELQAGSYCLMDASYHKYENIGSRFRCAATIYSMVIGRPVKNRIVIDAGLKAMSTDMGIPQPIDKNIVPGEIHEEHFCLELKNPASGIRTGDKIELIPTHACTTVNLYDKFYCVRGDELEAVWNISARGKLQ